MNSLPFIGALCLMLGACVPPPCIVDDVASIGAMERNNWQLKGMKGADGAPVGTAPLVKFTDNQRFHGTTGCQSIKGVMFTSSDGRYTITDTEFGPMDQGCTAEEKAQAKAFIDALTGITRQKLKANQLWLGNDEEVLLYFENIPFDQWAQAAGTTAAIP